MSSIGARYGLPWRYIWSLGANAELAARRDPAILMPGDVVQVPEREFGEEHRPTGASHRFKLTGGWTKFSVRFLFVLDPRPGLPARIEVGGRIANLTTDQDGRIACQIPADAPLATVYLTDEGAVERYDFDLGTLDPVESVQGQQQRLKNLGFNPGPVDGIKGPKTTAAVKRFQHVQKIVVDGVVGPITRGKLIEAHLS